jgi:DNA repair ATPase RecN
MFFKRVAGFLALVFGFVGVAACLAAIYGICVLGARLQHANDVVFHAVDKGLASAQERARGLKKSVEDSRITTSEIKDRLKDLGIREAKERVTARFEIESRAERLAGRLETADEFLENSTGTIRLMQQFLELGQSFGASTDPAALANLLESFEEARARLQQTRKTVERIQSLATGKDGEAEDSRLFRMTKLVARTLLTISEIDTRLDDAVARLEEMRTDAQQRQAAVSQYILLATIAGCVLFAWIAAGQAALCWCGWKGVISNRG